MAKPWLNWDLRFPSDLPQDDIVVKVKFSHNKPEKHAPFVQTKDAITNWVSPSCLFIRLPVWTLG